MAARFIVGIDLGTTNTACAFVDTAAGRALRVLEVPQLVALGEPGAPPQLPSFLYLARAPERTLAAGRVAGRPEVVMLEEPQAAFYAWLAANQADWRARVAAHPLVLVIDVGGGTTDLSLIAARASRGELGLERVAVGEHLLLGGDNIDLALAREVEARLLAKGGQLDTQRFYGLVSQCRAAKERLLADPTLGEVRLSVPGRGGAVIGGALAAALARAEVEATVLDRFFPRVEAEARPRPGRAPREWGLPFAEEPEITRHLAEFLARQRVAAGQAELPLARPDALLFNGGALEPEVVRERVCDVVASWHGGRRPAVLEGESLQLAVARGAAYFGLARRGLGVRIGGGAARTYYLGLGDGRALCLVPRGMEEGERLEIAEPEVELLANRPR